MIVRWNYKPSYNWGVTILWLRVFKWDLATKKPMGLIPPSGDQPRIPGVISQ